MEKQEQTLGPQRNSELAKVVISELDLLATLNMDYNTLGVLRRTKDFPAVYLNRSNRVYLLSEVTDWLQTNRGKHGADQE